MARKVKALQRIRQPKGPTIWDGRGGKLADARKTEFAGRAADDDRLTLVHYRLLSHFGRQNAKRGWLRVSQTELANAWECSRQRLNTAVGELCKWGYLRRVQRGTTGENFCYYQTVLDEPFEERGSDGTCPAGGTTTDPEVVPQAGQGCPEADDDAVPGTGQRPYIEHARTASRRDSPPPYPQGGNKRDDHDDFSDIDRLLPRVLAGGVSVEVCERLFRPILTKRRLGTADKLDTLITLGRKANVLELEALDRAAQDVLDADVGTVKQQRLSDAIDTAIKSGARVVVKPGSAQWHRWLEHLDLHNPSAAALARKLGVYQARTTWPVKPKSTGSAA